MFGRRDGHRAGCHRGCGGFSCVIADQPVSAWVEVDECGGPGGLQSCLGENGQRRAAYEPSTWMVLNAPDVTPLPDSHRPERDWRRHRRLADGRASCHPRARQGRARGAQDARADIRAGQHRIRSCTGTIADVWAHESVVYAVASAAGAAVLAAAATGSSLSHLAPMLSAMLASIPRPASARGTRDASSRRPPRAP
jgi:hypothetical protein